MYGRRNEINRNSNSGCSTLLRFNWLRSISIMSALSLTILAVCLAVACANPNPAFGGLASAASNMMGASSQQAMSQQSSTSSVVESVTESASSVSSGVASVASTAGASSGYGDYLSGLNGFYSRYSPFGYPRFPGF